LKHDSTLAAYFQHAIGWTLQNPRLKPGAIKFDAFSIPVSVLGLIFDIGVHQIRIFRTYTKPAVSRLPLKHNSTLPAYFQHAIGRAFQNPRLKPGAIKFDAFSIPVSDVRIPRPLEF